MYMCMVYLLYKTGWLSCNFQDPDSLETTCLIAMKLIHGSKGGGVCRAYKLNYKVNLNFWRYCRNIKF